jgi:GNAT superfamily N-acetyltransferase
MIFREAVIDDARQIMVVRLAVKENRLNNPALVTEEDCKQYLIQKGKGWVCIIDEVIVGFSYASVIEKNIWALFVHPNFEAKGIGKKLHDMMLNWYFSQTRENVWLSTAPGTRAEQFYRSAGWQATGIYGKGEIKFEMCYKDWITKK